MWKTSAQSRATFERHASLAQQCVKKLKAAGIDASTHDIRDVHGIRHDPVNMKLLRGQLDVLVRPFGWSPNPWSDDERRIAAGAWVQLGARDVDLQPLIDRIRQVLAHPWPTNPQTGKPLLLKN
jgi:hypothetical protein